MMRAITIVCVLAGAAHAGDGDDVAKLVDKQLKELIGDDLFVKEAPVYSSGTVQSASIEMIAFGPSSNLTKVEPTGRQITLAGDGKSAWVSQNVRIDDTIKPGKVSTDLWRVSELVVKTPAGWRIGAAAWTKGVPDATANKDAKANNKSAKLELGDKPGDASLRDAFAKLVTDGLDATAAARKDLVAIGSAPNERTTGGAMHAKAWAAWKGKAKVVSSVAGVAPSGTTGWVAANVEVDKGGYKIPFLVFCVFDKTAKGEWSVVHSHFAVE
jgi:hypothetical protein